MYDHHQKPSQWIVSLALILISLVLPIAGLRLYADNSKTDNLISYHHRHHRYYHYYVPYEYYPYRYYNSYYPYSYDYYYYDPYYYYYPDQGVYFQFRVH